MKDKLNKKTILIIIGALLIILIAILLFVLFGNKDKFKDHYEEVEKNITENLIYLKAGYITEYSGVELLFDEKNLDIKNLDDQSKFTYVFLNLLQNEEYDELSEETYDKIGSKLENIDEYLLISGETIKSKMKELLNIEWSHKSLTNIDNFIYNIEYLSNADVYLITPSSNYEKYEETLENNNKACVVHAIESKSTSKEIKTTIAVAYVLYPEGGDDNKIKYYSDKEQKNLVFEISTDDLYILDENEELVENPDVDSIKNHIDKFTKYEVTSTKNGDKFSISNIKQK